MRLARFTASLAATLALCTPVARAATISSDGSTITVTSGEEAENFYSGQAAGTITFSPNIGGAPLTADGDCTQAGTSVECPTPVAIVANLGGGNDDVSFDVAVPVEAHGGPGGDEIVTGTQNDSITGGLDADYIKGGAGADGINGGDGPDTFDLLDGGDVVSGGPGDDYIQFFTELQGVTVSLDDVANDGPTPSAKTANVHSDVEGIQGSPSDDKLTGNALVNDLSGNGGNDEVAGGGGGGSDRLAGDAGNDKLDSVNEAADSLGCGDGVDSIRMDPRDSVSDCESVEVVGPDNDGDGSKPPIDCDDNNASVKPGGNDVPGNGLDEDCSGADAPLLDADQDGSVDSVDCDDANRAIRPGAIDRPGNGIDEDCDGADDPYPLIAGSIAVLFSGTRITLLRVTGAPPGAGVSVRCRGRGCPFVTRSLRLRSGKATGTRIMRRRRLGRGAVLEVRLTARDTIGKVRRLTVRPNGTFRQQSLCLRPGARSPHRC